MVKIDPGPQLYIYLQASPFNMLLSSLKPIYCMWGLIWAKGDLLKNTGARTTVIMASSIADNDTGLMLKQRCEDNSFEAKKNIHTLTAKMR